MTGKSLLTDKATLMYSLVVGIKKIHIESHNINLKWKKTQQKPNKNKKEP